jgi:hypothetical protein
MQSRWWARRRTVISTSGIDPHAFEGRCGKRRLQHGAQNERGDAEQPCLFRAEQVCQPHAADRQAQEIGQQMRAEAADHLVAGPAAFGQPAGESGNERETR